MTGALAQRERTELFTSAVNAVASSLGRSKPVVLYDSRNRPIPPGSGHSYKRQAAKREGSMQNWIPRRLFGHQAESMERERIAERSINLVDDDPFAAGIVDGFATTVVGTGLLPHPSIDADALGVDRDQAREIQKAMQRVYRSWSPMADAAERMSDAGIQFLLQCSMVEHGEFFVALPMIDDPIRPYSLAVQVVHPMRVKTPSDFHSRGDIHDGVEIGSHGQPVAYWVKRSDSGRYLSDSSGNFIRIPARKAHRWNMVHGYIQRRPDQVRGVPFFAPAMKFFRDLHDYLDAELVANVVTAAYALFIETGASDAETLAQGMMYDDNDGTGKDLVRYEEIIPGMVMYGDKGQKPHPISANRPGTTFPVFVKEIKKAMAMALNMPYASLFHDVEGVNYAGFRSAMLEAWRVFGHRRHWLSTVYCGRTWPMLQEEAWLRGDLGPVADFYERQPAYCSCEWVGPPKGQIEPVKEIQAEVLAVNNRLKSRRRAISEMGGGDYRTVFDQIEEEMRDLEARGINPSVDPGEPDTTTDESEENEP